MKEMLKELLSPFVMHPHLTQMHSKALQHVQLVHQDIIVTAQLLKCALLELILQAVYLHALPAQVVLSVLIV